jgi:hypothetical protein
MLSFIDLLKQNNIDYRKGGEHHHVTANWIGFDCPFCSPGSGRFRMGYSLLRGNCSCWTCGFHHITKVISALLDVPYGKAKEISGSIDRIRIRHKPTRNKVRLPTGLGPLLPVHKSYLTSRGFEPTILQMFWKIGGIGLASDLAWRIWIPIINDGRTVTWTTRSLGDVYPRYINARPEWEELSSRSLLYGEDYARHAIVIVEGPTDVWRIGPGAVATMGLAYSTSQILRMSKYPMRVVCFDNEPEAQKRAKKLCRQLGSFPGKTHRLQLEAKDPGEASLEEVDYIRERFLVC